MCGLRLQKAWLVKGDCGGSCSSPYAPCRLEEGEPGAARALSWRRLSGPCNAGLLVVDKTGTLTEGRPVFDQAIGINGYAADVLLRLDASLDQGSEHPLAATIVDAATERRLSSSR